MRLVVPTCLLLMLAACGSARQVAITGTNTPRTRTCAGSIPAAQGVLKVQHKMLWLESGTLITTCSVSTLARRSSAVDFWLPVEEGHGTAACAVTEDVEGAPSGGLWVFNNHGAQSAVGYVDPERAMRSPVKIQCSDGAGN